MLLENPATKQKNDWCFNQTLFSRQQRVVEEKPTCLDQLHFHSILRLSCQFKSTLNLEDQETPSSGLCPLAFQACMNIWLEMSNLTQLVGSLKCASRHTTSNCGLIVTVGHQYSNNVFTKIRDINVKRFYASFSSIFFPVDSTLNRNSNL